MHGRSFYTYILASGPCGYLYVGVTNDLGRRIAEHKSGVFDGYTAEHAIDRLVWFEEHKYITQAIAREKRIKRWRREWKFALVEARNPIWADLPPPALEPTLLPARPPAVREV